MRRLLIAGNWKMNNTPSESLEYGRNLKARGLNDLLPEILLFPPTLSIPSLQKSLENTPVLIGGQNIHHEPAGAYTGETSAKMLADTGCDYVLIGHSERRQYFYETDESVRSKIVRAKESGLKQVVCIGETLEERDGGVTSQVIVRQLKDGLKDFTQEDLKELVLAYEPVWAIGTGKTATPEQAQDVHALIRKTLSSMFGEAFAENIRILYGGSANPANAESLLSEKDIDGLLIGGASLKPNDFFDIISTAHKLMEKG
jgi:triosephosphate isomerase